MPTTLEDTVEFQAITLNDLLEADAKAGVGPVGADEGKYKTWFMVSSAAAAIFAVLFVGALVTGGGGGNGTDIGKSIDIPAGSGLKRQVVPTAIELPQGTGPRSQVSISSGRNLLVPNALVLSVRNGNKDVNGVQSHIVDVAVTDAELEKLRGQRNLQIGPPVDTPSSTETTATTAPAGTPAGESPTPAPATTPNN